MKVSIPWLKELVDLNIPVEKLLELIPLRIQGGIKEVGDDYFELDLKGYNRADLLSMRGVAQEVAAITESTLNFGDDDLYKNLLSQEFVSSKVAIENQSLSPLYAVAMITGLKVGKSDPEWVKRLEDSGMRSINNVADITNLVMLEYGQPLHAFDASKVKDQQIIVRTAKNGENLVTLDGKNHQLETTDLLITDPEKVLGLAGVMGGKNSEASDETTAILLEAAIFDPINIRRTAQRHHLLSEASKRFQHGLTKTRLLQALSAAIKMCEDLGGKLTALTIVGNTKDPVKTINLSLEKTNSLIGIELTPKQVAEYLTRLGFKLASKGDARLAERAKRAFRGWKVYIPYWRLDIEIEEDLIEEIARLYGYEKIPAKELAGELPEKIDQSLFNLITDLKNKLVGLGLTEVQTYSFYSTKVLQSTGKDRYLKHYVKVANPMSKETEYLRSDLWPNLVEVVDKNMRQGFADIAVFEVGKVYNPSQGELPEEEYRLAIALMNGSDNPIQELAIIINEITGVRSCSTPGVVSIPDQYAKDYFHPKRFVHLEKDGKVIGGIAEVHPRILDRMGITKRVAILELNITTLL